MGWITYYEKKFLGCDAINLDHVELFGTKDNVVFLKAAKVQYELHYADSATAQEAYYGILTAIVKDLSVAVIVAPEQAWKQAMES